MSLHAGRNNQEINCFGGFLFFSFFVWGGAGGTPMRLLWLIPFEGQKENKGRPTGFGVPMPTEPQGIQHPKSVPPNFGWPFLLGSQGKEALRFFARPWRSWTWRCPALWWKAIWEIGAAGTPGERVARAPQTWRRRRSISGCLDALQRLAQRAISKSSRAGGFCLSGLS